MPTLTIFANFRINNEERYQRMKDSFESFKDINAKKWVINVRGIYKLKTILFLREQLGEKLYPHMIESGNGWFDDTKQVLPQIDTDFVFFWIEDHINMVDVKKYVNIISEMKDNNVSHLVYSWWHDEAQFDCIDKVQTESLNIYDLNKKTVSSIEKYINSYFYPISAVSFSSVIFFKNIINTNHPKLKRWPKETPFDFEKRSTDTDFLPFKLAIPKYELFASIDDDHGHDGYSLISRGLYESTVSRNEMKNMELSIQKRKLVLFKSILPNRIKNILSNLSVILREIKYTWLD